MAAGSRYRLIGEHALGWPFGGQIFQLAAARARVELLATRLISEPDLLLAVEPGGRACGARLGFEAMARFRVCTVDVVEAIAAEANGSPRAGPPTA
jgi:hypothetical protein